MKINSSLFEEAQPGFLQLSFFGQTSVGDAVPASENLGCAEAWLALEGLPQGWAPFLFPQSPEVKGEGSGLTS